MKPFVATPLEDNERVFNYRISSTRQCVDNTFGILANGWGYLLTVLRHEPHNVETMVLECVTLHTMLRTACADDGAFGDRENKQHNLSPGSWITDNVLGDL